MESHSALLSKRDEGRPRERIMVIVRARRRMTVAELREQLPLAWGTLAYHLGELSALGQLRVVRAGRHNIVTAAGESPTAERVAQLALVQGKTARRVAQFISDRPGVDVPQVAAGLGISQRIAYYHVKRLLRANLIEGASRTSRSDLRPLPILLELLAERADTEKTRGSDQE